ARALPPAPSPNVDATLASCDAGHSTAPRHLRQRARALPPPRMPRAPHHHRRRAAERGPSRSLPRWGRAPRSRSAARRLWLVELLDGRRRRLTRLLESLRNGLRLLEHAQHVAARELGK